jgi:hypothetical protein
MNNRVKWLSFSLLPIALLFSGAIVLASIYRSYTYDFQAQGRYIFPAIPLIMGVLTFYRKSRAMHYGLLGICLILGLLSYYSLTTYG